MKTALLVPITDTHTGIGYWHWETPSEHDLSKLYDTREDALAHRPNPEMYVCRDDGYRRI